MSSLFFFSREQRRQSCADDDDDDDAGRWRFAEWCALFVFVFFVVFFVAETTNNFGQEPKHAHLKFYRHDGTTLSFVDVRRFGKWKLGETWGVNRGPDPTMEPEEFKYNILKNLDQKVFDQPIHLVLMNQKYFMIF